MSKKLKAVESNIQPNHKEAELWVTPTNNDGSKEVKYWNSKTQEWSKCEGEGNGGDVEAAAEYYRIDWDKLNELGYTDDNFSNNASYFTRNSFFYCSKYKMEAQGDSGMMDMRDLWMTITMMSAYFKYSFITQVEFVPFTDSNGETFNSLQDAWRWSSQPFNEIFIPITKEEFYSLT